MSNNILLEKRSEELVFLTEEILKEKEKLELLLKDPKKALASLNFEEKENFYYLYSQTKTKFHDLAFAEKSPFFSRLELLFDDKKERETVYIGKFSFLSRSLYAWNVPVADLRFAEIGRFSYTRPNGEVRSGTLYSREDYFIANKRIISLYVLDENNKRVSIYDQFTATKKSGFGLSDIVQEIEKAQNEIVKLKAEGAMVIAGPAGSGKTTLALHRVAYLLQNPDTSRYYSTDNTIILVQDVGSIDYFSALFDSLGVSGVCFSTLESWLCTILDLDSSSIYLDRAGSVQTERDYIEWLKVQIIKKEIGDTTKLLKNPWVTLSQIYNSCEDTIFQAVWKYQKMNNQLDRQDMTLLLKIQKARNANVVEKTVFTWKQGKDGSYKVKKRIPLEYGLIVVDEFENYTATQLQIIQSTASKQCCSLFVGDIAQQTRFGSVASFDECGIKISKERNILLSKVYRNSIAVISLLTLLRYSPIIQANSQEGGSLWVKKESFSLVDNVSLKSELSKESQIGIICYDVSLVGDLKNSFFDKKDIHIGTVAELQGLEFDSVFVLGLDKKLFEKTGYFESFDSERKTIQREQLYVAITRARTDIIVVSDMTIDECIQTLWS